MIKEIQKTLLNDFNWVVSVDYIGMDDEGDPQFNVKTDEGVSEKWEVRRDEEIGDLTIWIENTDNDSWDYLDSL